MNSGLNTFVEHCSLNTSKNNNNNNNNNNSFIFSPLSFLMIILVR